MASPITALRTGLASLRMLVVLTAVLGVGYPLAVTAIAQLPGLKYRANGSVLTVDGTVVGSKLLGQSFLDDRGEPLVQYFQSRPSAAGAGGYDPTATSAGNLGPESIVDTLPDPAASGGSGKLSLLSQVCSRSLAVGRLEGADGSRPFCTRDGVGAVLAVFWSGPGYAGAITRVVSINQTGAVTPFLSAYRGVPVRLARFGEDYSHAQLVPVRGDAPAHPAVPADAVTASGSGLDPEISPAYAALQVARVARSRGVPASEVEALVREFRAGRDLGFLGEPRVNVLQLNRALDARYPMK